LIQNFDTKSFVLEQNNRDELAADQLGFLRASSELQDATSTSKSPKGAKKSKAA